VKEHQIQRRGFCTRCTGWTVAAIGLAAGARGQAPRLAGGIGIDGDFPGGNIVVEKIDGNEVFLHQDQRDTPGFWFYWYFRVRGAAGRTLAFHFTQGNVIGTRGPAVSTDGGKTWTWLAVQAVRGASFRYTFPEDAEDVRFCLAAAYLEADLHAFLHRHAGNPHLRVETHSTTKKGRKTQRLHVGKLDGPPEYRVLLTCRHHCCEMMASWALEGLLEAVLADTPDGRWFREHVEVAAVPMMDKDGVEEGDQGKNRKPHDHNRDYLGESIYPAVAALRQFAPKWSAGRLKLALDMHCPYIRGGGDGPSSNERVFLVGHPSEEMWRRQQQFGQILQQVRTGPLLYDPKHNIAWGKAWNTVVEPKSCSRWAGVLPGISLATTIEIPYASVGDGVVTPQSARLLGRDLARAVRQYLELVKSRSSACRIPGPSPPATC